ncbi:hypothetical protein GCM10011578_100230 [Streptomyces fuscichromogenes]|uniref:Uncharacterized protein n=1 Tax=Streptomyces fuscichromogenes TaxID=1324013 RepID=A0A917XPL4_9ACTN|nr:hypothetical protein GCM10011578_100230 [Streptomyces fuscichromogenes]
MCQVAAALVRERRARTVFPVQPCEAFTFVLSEGFQLSHVVVLLLGTDRFEDDLDWSFRSARRRLEPVRLPGLSVRIRE